MVITSGEEDEPAAQSADAQSARCARLEEGNAVDHGKPHPFSRVVRSKGFAWLATHHNAAVYWSHAGTHFELKNVGTWWAACDPATLPGGKLPDAVAQDFDGEYGDRRQELVFIGVAMDSPAICAALDECLLTDDEMAKYKAHFMQEASQ